MGKGNKQQTRSADNVTSTGGSVASATTETVTSTDGTELKQLFGGAPAAPLADTSDVNTNSSDEDLKAQQASDTSMVVDTTLVTSPEVVEETTQPVAVSEPETAPVAVEATAAATITTVPEDTATIETPAVVVVAAPEVVEAVVEAPAAPVAPVEPAPAPVVTKPVPVPAPAPKPVTAVATPAPAVPTMTTAIPAEGISRKGRAQLETIMTYVNDMRPRKPVQAVVGARHQVTLYRALLTIINDLEDDFQIVFATLLKLFEEHKAGVFHDSYIFRFMDSIELPENDRRALQRLVNMLKLMAPVKGREQAIKQVNLEDSLKYGVKESGRQRILAYFNR